MTVPASSRVFYDEETFIVSHGDVEIDGELLGVPEPYSGRTLVDAPTLVVESATKIVVRGHLRAADGRHGSASSAGIGILDLGLRQPDHPAEAIDHELRARLEELAWSPRDMQAAFRGGDGGTIVLRAPVVFIDGAGLVEAGNGGSGGPCARGGDGGSVIIDAPCLTDVVDPQPEARGGRGGRGGTGLHFVSRRMQGSGGLGGDAIAHQTVPPDVIAASPGSTGNPGSDMMGGDGADGRDGNDGVDCTNPDATDGVDGTAGGSATATDGGQGGAGRSGCPKENGQDGGKGGAGGNAQGGQGGNGGAGGNAFPNCQAPGTGGNGGDGGDGGDATAGKGGKGGNGGNGCPDPGSAGTQGRPGQAVAGQGGAGGAAGGGDGLRSSGNPGDPGQATQGTGLGVGISGSLCPGCNQ